MKLTLQRLTVRAKRQIEFFGLALGPVLLLLIGIVPKTLRFSVLIIVTFIVFFAIHLRLRKKVWKWKDLGIRSDNFFRALPVYFLFTTLAVCVIYLLGDKLGFERRATTISDMLKLAGLSFAVSVLQEFLYRGYLLRLAQDIWQSKWIIVLGNILFFTFLHSFYRDLSVIMPLAFVGGILFVFIYLRHPNLFLVCLMHIILNFTALHMGFFKI